MNGNGCLVLVRRCVTQFVGGEKGLKQVAVALKPGYLKRWLLLKTTSIESGHQLFYINQLLFLALKFIKSTKHYCTLYCIKVSKKKNCQNILKRIF